MSKREVRYYFGRLNLIAQRDDKHRLLVDSVQAEGISIYRGLNWGFFEVSRITTDLGEFICGFLARFRPLSEEEIAVPETHQIDSRTVENRVTAKARFFLHTASHIIAYHPFGREISRSVFVNRFKELFESNSGGFFVEVEILPIDEEHRIRTAMRNLQKISSVHVRLHPSNPANRDVWKSVDERLRRMQVGSYRENYDSDPSSDGLRISDDKEISTKIAMAEDGYGTVFVAGESDGKRRTISTRDTPVVAEAPGDDERAEVVLERLNNTVRSILQRFSE
jgi:hypothetical protein